MALALTGCLSPQKKAAEELPALHAHWQADVARQFALPERTLDWSQALALMQANNLKLRAARVDITNSQELATQAYRDLIPTINLRSGVTRSIAGFPSTAFDDVTFNVDSFFNVPGFVNFSTRVFAGRLTLLRSRTAYKLTEREQTIELYKIFLQAQDNAEQADELKSDLLLADAIGKADAFSGQVMLKEIRSRQLSLEKSRENFQAQVSTILADQQYHWSLVTNGLPQFDYEDHPLALNDTNSVAQLQTRLVALEFVAAWAQIHGIKLQYWPELAIFVGGPSVYQRVNGQNQFWSSADVTASANFFWSIDTRGYISQQLRQTRREQDLQAAQLQLDSRALIAQLIAAQRLAGSLRDQFTQLDKFLDLLGTVPQDADLSSIIRNADLNRTLRYQRFKLRQDLAEVNTLFWFVDERKWDSRIE